MKIPCSVVRDLLPLYAEEMIEEETRALVDEHLEECSECSQKLEEIKAAAAVPAENTAVDTAKPLLALKKMINKRRWITAAIAALCVFILLVSAFHRINEWHQVPWEEGLIQVTGVEKMADVEKRNNPFPEEEETIKQPDESRVLTFQVDSKITGINSAREIMEDGTVTEIIQGWSNNPNKKLTGDYSEITFCPVPDRVMYDTGNGQVRPGGTDPGAGDVRYRQRTDPAVGRADGRKPGCHAPPGPGKLRDPRLLPGFPFRAALVPVPESAMRVHTPPDLLCSRILSGRPFADQRLSRENLLFRG